MAGAAGSSSWRRPTWPSSSRRARTRSPTLDDQGLDIRPHRERMNDEDLAEKFKDADDPLRIVFVCAMWMTGFDAPSVSTIYLDRPMRNHTLMQTIARANRVFPDKDNGLIVDYIGVFRNLEKALAIYGAANAEAGVDSPIQHVDALVGALGEAIDELIVGCAAAAGVDLHRRCATPTGFEHIALRDAAVEALLVDEEHAHRVPGRGPPGPQAVQGAAARPGSRRAAAHRRRHPGARRTARSTWPGHRTPTSTRSPTPSTRCSTARSAPRSTSSGPPPRAASPTRSSTCPRSTSTPSPRSSPAASAPRPTGSRSCSCSSGRSARRPATRPATTSSSGSSSSSPTTTPAASTSTSTSAASSSCPRRSPRRSSGPSVEGLTEEELAIFDLLTKPEPVLTDDERERREGAAPSGSSSTSTTSSSSTGAARST